jgi:hypothetical protein
VRYNHLMVSTSILLLLLGVSFIVNAPWMFSFYGINLSEPSEPQLVIRHGPDPLMVGLALMRVMGAMLIGLGVIAWLIRNVQDSEWQANISLGFLVFSSLSCLSIFLQHIQVGMVLPQLTSSSARLLAALFLLLSAAFGYIRFVRLDGR